MGCLALPGVFSERSAAPSAEAKLLTSPLSLDTSFVEIRCPLSRVVWKESTPWVATFRPAVDVVDLQASLIYTTTLDCLVLPSGLTRGGPLS